MTMKTALAAAALTLLAVPAVAGTCNEPVAPVISINGATASETEMKGAIADFKIFQSGADDFENCISSSIKAKAEEAKNSKDQKTVDPAILSALRARADAVQAEKEKLGGQLNVQIIAYKKAHPKPQ